MAVQYFFKRGKTYACNNTTHKWFENVREHKPHIYYANGEWHVVVCGSYMNYHDAICSERNQKAQLWMARKNGERDGTNQIIRGALARLMQFTGKAHETSSV